MIETTPFVKCYHRYIQMKYFAWSDLRCRGSLSFSLSVFLNPPNINKQTNKQLIHEQNTTEASPLEVERVGTPDLLSTSEHIPLSTAQEPDDTWSPATSPAPDDEPHQQPQHDVAAAPSPPRQPVFPPTPEREPAGAPAAHPRAPAGNAVHGRGPRPQWFAQHVHVGTETITIAPAYVRAATLIQAAW